MTAPIRTTIDAGGRVVIPKQFREELGLTPRTPVDVEVKGLSISITPVEPEVVLVREGRVLVAHHPNRGDFVWTGGDVRALREKIRDERDRRLL